MTEMVQTHKPFTVQFVGDYFSLQTSVELDLTEPDIAGKDIGELIEVAEDTAKRLLMYHYGWDMDVVATVDTEVLEG
jgi:hypothetical protein